MMTALQYVLRYRIHFIENRTIGTRNNRICRALDTVCFIKQ